MHIAKEQIASVITRAYVLSNIRPEKFVTYLFDNGDVNIESIYGRSYHCTNTNAIQQKSIDIPVQTAAPATVTSNCRKNII